MYHYVNYRPESRVLDDCQARNEYPYEQAEH